MRPLQQNDVFHAIAHPARRAILIELRDGEKPAGALAAPFAVSAAAISQHLKVLKDAALVSERREGRQRLYQLHAKPLRAVVGWVDAFESLWNGRFDALARYLDRKHGRRRGGGVSSSRPR